MHFLPHQTSVMLSFNNSENCIVSTHSLAGFLFPGLVGALLHFMASHQILTLGVAADSTSSSVSVFVESRIRLKNLRYDTFKIKSHFF